MAIRRRDDLKKTVDSVKAATFSYDATTDVPLTDTTLITNSGDKTILVTGWSISCFGQNASTVGEYWLTDGNKSGTSQVLAHIHQGASPSVNSLNLGEHPVALTAGNDLKITGEESNGHFFMYGSVYYIEI